MFYSVSVILSKLSSFIKCNYKIFAKIFKLEFFDLNIYTLVNISIDKSKHICI